VPRRAQGCCIESEELFAAIDQELDGSDPRARRTYTLLGPNKPWQSRLRENHPSRLARAYAALTRVLFPLTIFRAVLGLLFDFCARRSPSLQLWHLNTIRPRSIQEVMTLYNKYNYNHVKIVGYNNGVVHFGHRYPSKTVVSTACCNRRARMKGDVAEFDAGVTIRQAMTLLGEHGRELLVLPNFSYVALGTGYFVPIHGSASEFTTIAETIQKVILYDPLQDRVLAIRREDPVFAHYLYNLGADVLLLRLQVQTKPKARYCVRQLKLTRPTGQEVLEHFHDRRPSNVEVRKAGSAAETVQVYQYFHENAGGDGSALEVPRDALGRLWDRLEENRLSRVLFHALNRWLAYHVELFLSEEDFVSFWATHWSLPVLKIQLRFIRRDGFPNSPFAKQDCVSADLFMFKKHKQTFDSYLQHTLPAAKMNPGKHST
jgi:hypothetical protein